MFQQLDLDYFVGPCHPALSAVQENFTPVVRMFGMCLYVYLSVYLSGCLSVCLCACLFVCLFCRSVFGNTIEYFILDQSKIFPDYAR